MNAKFVLEDIAGRNLTAASSNCKSKPLLQWMDDGDPDLMPVLMSDPWSTTASYFGVPVRDDNVSTSHVDVIQRPITLDLLIRCHEETGMGYVAPLGPASFADAIPFIDQIQVSEREERYSEGVRRKTTIRTPVGEVTEVYVTPIGRPGCWIKNSVETDADLAVMSYVIEAATTALLDDVRVREALTAKFRAEAAKWPPHVVLHATVGIPAFVSMSNRWMDPAHAILVLADHRSLMERLFEAEMQALPVWVECAADAGADFLYHAINGLELYSPSIYRDYFIPQARTLHDLAHARGVRGWVHTCGHLDELIRMGVHHEMRVDVLESLSHPPLGDIIDFRAARTRLGDKMVTRGAVNLSLFCEPDPEQVRDRTRQVLDDVRGYRHMIGDTDDPYPPYSRDSILAMVDEVRNSGRMLELR